MPALLGAHVELAQGRIGGRFFHASHCRFLPTWAHADGEAALAAIRPGVTNVSIERSQIPPKTYL